MLQFFHGGDGGGGGGGGGDGGVRGDAAGGGGVRGTHQVASPPRLQAPPPQRLVLTHEVTSSQFSSLFLGFAVDKNPIS